MMLLHNNLLMWAGQSEGSGVLEQGALKTQQLKWSVSEAEIRVFLNTNEGKKALFFKLLIMKRHDGDTKRTRYSQKKTKKKTRHHPPL